MFIAPLEHREMTVRKFAEEHPEEYEEMIKESKTRMKNKNASLSGIFATFLNWLWKKREI